MTRADRIDLIRRARVPLWRGCVLTDGVVLTGPFDGPDEYDVPYWTAWCASQQFRVDVVVEADGPVWIDNAAPALIDPDAPENLPHLLAELARRRRMDPSYGVLLAWLWGRWWLASWDPGAPTADLGHPEIPDTAEGCIDVVCLALSETEEIPDA